MTVFAVVNQTGGSGKSTTAVNLAACWAESGHSVRVVDLDQQADATHWLGVGAASPTTYDVLIGAATLDEATTSTPFGVDVAPAGAELRNVERALIADNARIWQHTLRDALRQSDETYELTVLDCPGSLGMVTVAAMVAADALIVPVAAGAKELRGLAQLQDTATTVAAGLNPTLRIGHILLCRWQARQRISRDVSTQIRARYPAETLTAVIRERTTFREAPAYNEPITSYDAAGDGAGDYRAAAAEILAAERTHHA